MTFILGLSKGVRRRSEELRYRRRCARIARMKCPQKNCNWRNDARTTLWAHAGSGKLHLYGNSMESYDDAIARGYGVIEADVSMTLDGVPVMSHRFRPNNEIVFDRTPTCKEFLSTKIGGRYTPMSLEMFIDRYENKDVFISIDPSPSIRADGCGIELVRYLAANAAPRLLGRIIYQINGLAQLEMIGGNNPFGALHYGLDSEVDEKRNRWRVGCLLPALASAGVESVSITDLAIDDEAEWDSLIGSIIAYNIVPVVTGVNSEERRARWQRIGVTHFNTDYLEP